MVRPLRDFQQYGGLTHKVFDGNKEMESFLNDVKALAPNGFKNRESYYRPVKDKKVILQSVWGVDYGKARGVNNVDEFHQGPMKLVKKGKYWSIVSNHYANNGTIPTGDYAAIYHARYYGGSKNRGLKDARLGVFAIGQMSRTVKRI